MGKSRVGNLPVEFLLGSEVGGQEPLPCDGIFYQFVILYTVFVFLGFGNDQCGIFFLFQKLFPFGRGIGRQPRKDTDNEYKAD